MNVIKMWWLSLAIAGAVVGAVVALLWRIITAVEHVDHHAAEIWVEGKKIAGNTVSIWMLEKTNEQLARLVQAAESLERFAAAIDERLRTPTETTGERG